MSSPSVVANLESSIDPTNTDTTAMKKDLDGLWNSPAAILEQLCKSNNLEIEYVFIDFVEESSSEPAHYIIETRVTGVFPLSGPAKITKKFMGSAKTDAKDNSVASALSVLKNLSPGVQCQPGDLPVPWMNWTLSNLQSGCSSTDIIDVLLLKGFQLCNNVGFMQLLCTWNSFTKFFKRNGRRAFKSMLVDSCMARVSDCPTEAIVLPTVLGEWIDLQLSLGTDGKVIVTVLESNCIHLLSFPELRCRVMKNAFISDETLDCASMTHFMYGSPGINNNIIRLRDFWRCCGLGIVDDVVSYIAAKKDVNARQLDSHGLSMTGLLLASENGHLQVIEALVNAGADLNLTTENGLSCLHLAARSGLVDTCDNLMKLGLSPYLRDCHGNTALHYACREGDDATINVLVEGSISMVRNVTSGKVSCALDSAGKDVYFDDLVKLLFEDMQKIKLTDAMMRRFEKSWVLDAANMLVSKMTPRASGNVEIPSVDVVDDVMKRFDPDPDASISLVASDDQDCVEDDLKVIQEPLHLQTILSWCYRLAAVNPPNKIKRTPLHDCCFANFIDSHLSSIHTLVEEYGSNTYAIDVSGYRPIDLVAQHKNRPGTPSGTDLREEVLFEKRSDRLNDMKIQKLLVLQKEKQARQVTVLTDACKSGYFQSQAKWNVTEDMSSIEWDDDDSRWKMGDDPDCGNQFYFGPPFVAEDPEPEVLTNAVQEVKESNPIERITYNWFFPPSQLRYKAMMNDAWRIKKYQSQLIRTISSWEMYHDCETDTDFYFNPQSEEYSIECPRECQGHVILRTVTQLRRLGFRNEWIEYKDKNDGLCYVNSENNLFLLTRPIAAINITELAKKCTRETSLMEPVHQGWYTCDECNESNNDGEAALTKLCISCAKTCHGSHKGVRFIRSSVVVCSCGNNCETLVESYDDLHNKMKIIQQDLNRSQIKTLRSVEDVHFIPTPLKSEDIANWPGGWHFCRTVNKTSKDDWREYSCYNSTGQYMSGSFALVSHPLLISSIKFLCTIIDDNIQTKKTRVSFYRVAESHVMRDFDIHRLLDLLNAENADYLHRENDLRKKLGMQTIAARNIEILSDLELFDSCIVERCCVDMLSKGQYDLNGSFSRESFGFNQQLNKFHEYHEGAVVDESLKQNPPLCPKEICELWDNSIRKSWSDQKYVTLNGCEWLQVDKESAIMRSFGAWNEMKSSCFDVSYFKNESNYIMERSVLCLQRVFRKKFFIPYKNVAWYSIAYSFKPNESIMLFKISKLGWNVMRRRSKKIRTIVDTNKDNWQEMMDSVTGELYYFNVQSDSYKWDRPASLSSKSSSMNLHVQAYKVNDTVNAIFPGESIERLSRITKVREEIDEESGDLAGILYDIESMGRERKMRFASSSVIRGLRLSGEELNLRRQEVVWKNNLKRTRESRKRKAERDRKKLAESIKTALRGESRLYVPDSMDETSVSEVAKKRLRRCELEQEEIDKKVQDALEAEAKILILLTSGLESGGEAKQNKKQEEKYETTSEDVIDLLKKFETGTTSPRTDRRRHVLRYLHVSMQRQSEKYVICEWGCKKWVKFGQSQFDHEKNECSKRVLQCPQACPLRMKYEDWKLKYNNTNDTIEDHHCKNDCPKRLVACPQLCGTWIAWEVIEFHTSQQCVRRPAAPIFCRNNCGQSFGGTMEELIMAEEERMNHESENCPVRNVKCTWPNCGVTIRACERESHRDYHIQASGITKYLVPGSHIFVNSMFDKQIKIQAWGAGGGSGYFKDRKAGNGGGGALVEIIVAVGPGDILDIKVGQGGMAGVAACVSIHDDNVASFKLHEQMMTTIGGNIGGGNGHSACEMYACGSGGGYTSVYKRSAKGPILLLVSGSGGGGGSLDGLPATGLTGPLKGSLIDLRNGQSADELGGGQAGFSPNTLVAKFPAEAGIEYKGGAGAETAAGGGSGYYGGGGGGTGPGSAGGGGGGSSWVNQSEVLDSVVIQSQGKKCGGSTRNPPSAIGIAEWDVISGNVGDGGTGNVASTDNGRHGCVIVYKTGFY